MMSNKMNQSDDAEMVNIMIMMMEMTNMISHDNAEMVRSFVEPTF